MLLHQPFESFDPVVQFLREAVHDPDVLAIKQTIYRTGSESPLMDLLIDAARRGKEVMAVVELKARFDEEANINWAERLEAVGAQVVYGIVGLKTHAKLLLVTRREDGPRGRRLRRYCHFSTGNYNPKTARLYTDVGMLTANGDLTADADAVFQQLASLGKTRPLRALLQAPFTLHRRLLQHIAQVEQAALAGRRARIVVKINALTDVALIEALIRASQAGVSIDLVVRGACVLPPGLPGRTDRIRVRSVVGRFLEHTRVFYFCWGDGDDEQTLYLSSADWMSRNMFRRIEVAWPVRDPLLRQRVIDECLVPYLHDRRDAWEQQSDGSYRRIGTGRTGRPAGADAPLLTAPGGACGNEETEMDLILWRHAEAHPQRDGQTDLERALTAKGERQAERMAEWLNRRLADSTRILVSPALRTQQTARALGAAVPDGAGAGARSCASTSCCTLRAGPTPASRCSSSAISRRSVWWRRGCLPASIGRGRSGRARCGGCAAATRDGCRRGHAAGGAKSGSAVMRRPHWAANAGCMTIG